MFAGKLRQWANHILLENPGRRKSLDEWAQTLQRTKTRLAKRLAAAKGDEAHNRAILNHIIGIERWGQRRLRVFLGQPSVRDEYDGYRPRKGQTWPELVAEFEATRDETVAIVEQLAAVPEETLPPSVNHNQHGALSVYAWLRYMDMHASWEARRIR